MNVLYRESDGSPIHADPAEELGAGGQARVVGVRGRPELVAKLYHAPAEQHARKLRVMLANPPAASDAAGPGDRPGLVWPADLLRDEQGRTVGLLLPRVTGMQRAFELYNPATRRVRSPRFDYARLHRTARNVAAAFAALHAAGYVVGDANESNVLVDGEGNVTVIDTDSFQVSDPATGEVFRCPVGRPEFAPPELQGMSLGSVDRTPEHDRFALGVLVFQLLMEGTHPFAGGWNGAGDPPPVPERIAAGLYPHTPGAEVRPPRNAPPLALLHPLVRGAVRRCFEVGQAQPSARPHAHEWVAALDAALAELVTCRANPRHVHGRHLRACPWCERTRTLGGRDPFPSAAAVARGDHLKAAPRRRPAAVRVAAKLRGPRLGTPPASSIAGLPPFVANRWTALAALAATLGLVADSLPLFLVLGACLLLAGAAAAIRSRAGLGVLLMLLSIVVGSIGLGLALPEDRDYEPPVTAEQARANRVFEPGALDRLPVLLDPAALIAAAGRLRSSEDSTYVSFNVGLDGRIEPASFGILNDALANVQAAREALPDRALFTPGLRQRTPARVRVEVPLVRQGGRVRVLLDQGTWNPEPAKAEGKDPRSGVSSAWNPDLLVVETPAFVLHPDQPQPVLELRPRAVERTPKLLNGAEVQALLRQHSNGAYVAGTAGAATEHVHVRIRADGTVDPASVRWEGTTRVPDPLLAATRAMRFRPARVGGRDAEVWAVTWFHRVSGNP